LRNYIAAFFDDNNLKCQIVDRRDDTDPEKYLTATPVAAPASSLVIIHAADGNAMGQTIFDIVSRFPLRVYLKWTLPQELKDRDPNMVLIDIQNGSVFQWK
jgi:hypothetical protein